MKQHVGFHHQAIYADDLIRQVNAAGPELDRRVAHEQCSILEHSQSCYAELDRNLGYDETSQVENIGEMVLRMV